MKEKDLNQHKFIESLISSNRINKSIAELKKSQILNENRNFSDSLSKIEETYRYMTHYLFEGAADSGREKLLNELKERLFSVNDLVLREFESKEKNNFYYSTLRFNNYKQENFASILKRYNEIAAELSLTEATENESEELRKEKENLLEGLFNTILTSYGKESEYNDLTDHLLSGYADASVTTLSIAALILGLLYFYDRSKVITLFDLFERSEQDESLWAKSLAGIVFGLMFYGDRIKNDSTLTQRMELWKDQLTTYQQLRETVRVIAGTRDTQRIADKMREEIIPDLIKLRPEMMKYLKDDVSQNMSINPEGNPEWEELLEKSGLNKKMQELNDMQSEGADLMMVTFSNLKNFPFFNSPSNWFLPFDPAHSSIKIDKRISGLLDLLQTSGSNICDSDLYSLAIASQMMPEQQMQMISGQLSEQIEQLKEDMSDSFMSTKRKFSLESLKFIRELYRFFKLYKKNDGFKNPFDHPLDFTSFPVVGEMLSNDQVLELIGEFYFKRGYYKDALPLLSKLIENNPENGTYYEKRGYCFQNLGDYINAREDYERATLLKNPTDWLIRRLAFINRRLGNAEEAIKYYDMALESDPDNLSLLMNSGNCYLEAENIPGALTRFYHANYISPENPRVLRALAWMEFLNGNFAKSLDYYMKIIRLEARSSDYLNAGHAELLSGHYRDALNYYRLSAKDDKELFEKSFLSDLPTLIDLGMDQTTAMIVLDTI